MCEHREQRDRHVALAVGRYDPAVLDRICRAASLEPERQPLAGSGTGDGYAVHANLPVRTYERGAERGLWWAAQFEPASPVASWHGASVDADACGVWCDPDGTVTVFPAASGVRSLYAWHDAEASYLCTDLDALARCVPRPLAADWHAWAQILVLSFPLGARTPFATIERLDPAGVLRWSPGGQVRRDRTGWAWPDLPAPGAPRDGQERALAESLRSAVRALPGGEVLHLLSGGWDSRLLAALLVERLGSDAVRAVTVDTDKGRIDELRLAGVAAHHLGIGHAIAEAAWDGYWHDATSTAELVSYQTSHHVWMHPIIDAARRRWPGRSLPHGLAGDVLLKGSSLAPGAMHATGREAWVDALWSGFGAEHPARQLLRPDLAAQAIGSAREAFTAEVGAHWGHPAATSLAAYWTRGRRAVGLAVEGMLDSVGTGSTPFVHPQLVATALQVPDRAKADRTLYRALLDSVDPALRALPSTNTQPRSPRLHLRREATVGTSERYASVLAQGHVAPLLGDKMRRAISQGYLDQLVESRRSAYVLRGLVLYGLWVERYRDVLDPTSVEPRW